MAQWFSYITGVCFVQFLIIFPLSVLLFHDFYSKLLPPDSSQWVGINNFETEKSHLFSQKLERIESHKPLISVKPNGLPQTVGLREQTDYRLDLQLDFYCACFSAMIEPKAVTGMVYIDLVDQLAERFYSYKGPVLCFSTVEDTGVLAGNKHLSSRKEVIKNEWLNSVHIEDVIEVNHDLSQLTISIKINNHTGSSFQIIPEPSSGVLFRRFFNNGLRNWMLRRWRTTYILGISIFYISLSFTFVITCISSFFIFSLIKTKEKKA